MNDISTATGVSKSNDTNLGYGDGAVNPTGSEYVFVHHSSDVNKISMWLPFLIRDKISIRKIYSVNEPLRFWIFDSKLLCENIKHFSSVRYVDLKLRTGLINVYLKAFKLLTSQSFSTKL